MQEAQSMIAFEGQTEVAAVDTTTRYHTTKLRIV